MANTKKMEQPTRRVLLYGPSGSGKTQLASTFPHPIFIDLDDGMLTLRGQDIEYYTITRNPTTDPDAIKILAESFDPVNDNKCGPKALKLLPPKTKLRDVSTEEIQKVLGANLAEEGSAYDKSVVITEYFCNTLSAEDTLIIDSITFLNDYALEQVLDAENQKKPRIQDWGSAQKLVETIIEQVNFSACNVVVIAHEQFIKDDDSGLISWLPATIGKLATKLPIFFDEVYHTYVSRGTGKNKDALIYGIETSPTRHTTAKSRCHLKGNIENVTYASLYK